MPNMNESRKICILKSFFIIILRNRRRDSLQNVPKRQVLMTNKYIYFINFPAHQLARTPFLSLNFLVSSDYAMMLTIITTELLKC